MTRNLFFYTAGARMLIICLKFCGLRKTFLKCRTKYHMINVHGSFCAADRGKRR
nr:MAG TPA: hypothetical protein [Caudoviricetes sp.]